MLKFRTKHRKLVSDRAVRRLAAIERSIKALDDEDLLDLADIFASAPSPLSDIATLEMANRKISL